MGSTPKLIQVAVGIVVEGGRFLITRRLATAELPDLWEFPGGKIEANETPQAAAVRELQEELGITVEATQVLAIIEHTYDHGKVVLHPVLCRRMSGDPHPLQCAAFQWVTPGTLSTLPMPTANATLLPMLAQLHFRHPPGTVTPSNPGD